MDIQEEIWKIGNAIKQKIKERQKEQEYYKSIRQAAYREEKEIAEAEKGIKKARQEANRSLFGLPKNNDSLRSMPLTLKRDEYE